MHDNSRTASLATIPQRIEMLAKVVERMLPQVDRLNVYLNGYASVPEFLIDHPKIRIARSQDHGDRGDAGKFFWVGQVIGFHVSVDDDIDYPTDLVDQLVAGVERHRRRAVVGFHGAVIAPNATDYYRSRKTYHCVSSLAEDTPVHVLGTGCACFHTSTLRASIADFPEPNMADIWLALLGQDQCVPFVTLARRDKYLKPMDVSAGSIFESSRVGDRSPMDTHAQQAALVLGRIWTLPALGQAKQSDAVDVVVMSFNRPITVIRLLRDLVAEREQYRAGLSIRVYDDASTLDYSSVRDFCRWHGVAYIRAERNFGRADHADWVSRSMHDSKATGSAFHISLPDDVRMLPGGIARAIKIWRALPKDRSSLSLAVVTGREGVPGWTGVIPAKVNADTVLTGWVDGLYLCDRRALEALNFRVPPFAKVELQPGRSSGVGREISRGLLAKGLQCYGVTESLVTNLPDSVTPSVMHPQYRKEMPHRTLRHFNDPPLPEFIELPVKVGEATAVFAAFEGDHIAKILASGNLYELDLLTEIKRIGRRGVYVDVGAFIGTHATFFSLECPSSMVIAVEANPDHFALLNRNVARNCPNTHAVFGAVLEDESRARSLPAERSNRGMSKVAAGGDGMGYTLDEILAYLTPAVIKIDTEGFEPSVLRSGAQVIARARPLIIAEAPTEESVRLIEAELPSGYIRSRQFCRTPTYIWEPGAGGMELSFIVPCHVSGLPLLLRQLRSLALQSAPASSFEVVVGCDGGCEGFELIDTPFEVRLEPVTRTKDLPHRNHARNAALRAARGRWCWVVDADFIFSANAVEEALRVMAAAERRGQLLAVSPILRAIDVSPEVWLGQTESWMRGDEVTPTKAITSKVRVSDDVYAGHGGKLNLGSDGLLPLNIAEGFPLAPAGVFEALNYFDEAFLGWGGNKEELTRRLGRLQNAGLTYQLLTTVVGWHQPHKADPAKTVANSLRMANQQRFASKLDDMRTGQSWWLEQLTSIERLAAQVGRTLAPSLSRPAGQGSRQPRPTQFSSYWNDRAARSGARAVADLGWTMRMFEKISALTWKPLNTQIRRARKAHERRVLDFGCGAGRFTSKISALDGVQVTGVDFSPAMIDLACSAHPGCDFRLLESERLPFADDTFNVIITAMTLQHIPDCEIKGAVAELLRVARPAALLILLEQTDQRKLRIQSGGTTVSRRELEYRQLLPGVIEVQTVFLGGVAHSLMLGRARS